MTVRAINVVVCMLSLIDALRLPIASRTRPLAMQLLGADGLPLGGSSSESSQGGGLIIDGNLGGGGAAGAPGILGADGSAASGDDSIPDDLKDFDPTFDPLAAKRPKYDLAAASGRGDETVWGATAPEAAADIQEWVSHLRDAGIQRVLGLFSEDEAAARGPDGSARGYMEALVAAGFDPTGVALLDPHAPGSRDIVMKMAQDAQQARQTLCIHCADGHRLTAIAMADWLMVDYIGGDNYLEACDALAARKRLAGVARSPSEADVEQWTLQGHL